MVYVSRDHSLSHEPKPKIERLWPQKGTPRLRFFCFVLFFLGGGRPERKTETVAEGAALRSSAGSTIPPVLPGMTRSSDSKRPEWGTRGGGGWVWVCGGVGGGGFVDGPLPKEIHFKSSDGGALLGRLSFSGKTKRAEPTGFPEFEKQKLQIACLKQPRSRRRSEPISVPCLSSLGPSFKSEKRFPEVQKGLQRVPGSK